MTYTEPVLSKPSAASGKFLSDAKYAFNLEAYANGTPAPTVVTKEVNVTVAGPFLFAKPDFSKNKSP